jgi:alkylation response protein AidB-like acyl-CoA dehydrogenase
LDDTTDLARLIADSAAALVPPDGDLARVRACRFTPPGFDLEAYRRTADLGWLLLAVDEANGGLALGLGPWCALSRQLGRGLVPEPLTGAILACRLAQGFLPDDLRTGRSVIATAWQGATNDLTPGTLTVAGGKLSGRRVHVPGAGGAAVFAVVTPEAVALVRRDAPGVRLETAPMQDGTLHGTLTLRNTAATLHPVPGIAEALDDAMLAHSAYLHGLAERAFEITLDYLRLRHQFGRPIGAFQALQHRATEMKIQLELTRAAIDTTAARLDAGLAGPARAAAVSRAKARAADLAMLVAREALQMHGAIGYTDEADIGLFIRKAMTEANLYGSAARHRARYLAAVEPA